MSESSTSPAPRARSSEDKLYQACLDACIAALEEFPVDKQSDAVAKPTNNNTDTADCHNSVIAGKPQGGSTVISASSSLPPGTDTSQQQSHSLLCSASLPAVLMDRSKYSNLHGAPPKGPKGMQPRAPPAVFPQHPQAAQPRGSQAAPAQVLANATPSWGTQDARGSQDMRSNLAVQPAANAGSLKLKKKAVKIVGPARALSGVSLATPTPTPSATSSPLEASSALVNKTPLTANWETGSYRETESYASLTPTTPAPTVQSARINTETPKQSETAEDSLENMFTRLMTPSNGTLQVVGTTSSARPSRDTFSFESSLSEADVSKKILGDLVANMPKGSVEAKHGGHEETMPSKIITNAPLKRDANKPSDHKAHVSSDNQVLSQQELENEYMRKALDYINTLPGTKGTTTHTFKLVTKKLRDSYLPNVNISPKEIEASKARYVFAVTKYVKGLNKGTTGLTSNSVNQILEEIDGDFLQLCATLVEQEYIALDNLEEIRGLCKVILDVLPNPDLHAALMVSESKVPHAAPSSKPVSELLPKLTSKDPVDSMTDWPSREKRKDPAGYRTCVLKGVAGVKTIHQLQALVWGGKLEAISMPDNSGFGTVRFLTAEGCQKYYEATQNGIEVSGEKDKKMIVLVERTEGPNSTNDVMRACAEGDATRCVRAVGADDEWTDMLLLKLARGQDKIKRELDTIKHGKTSRGYNYIEFRFANIYHALSFKRQLMNEEDWEHCTIGYASDPCEVAHGVHYDDMD